MLKTSFYGVKAKAKCGCSFVMFSLCALALCSWATKGWAQEEGRSMWSAPGSASLARQKGELLMDLKRFGGSPAARIEFASAKPGAAFFDIEGSRSFTKKDGSCMVRMAADAKGRFSIVSAMAFEMGLEASPEMARQINLFEALHELGHCAWKATGAELSHPGLAAEENASLGRLIERGRGGQLLAEAFADAYAGLSMLSEAVAAGRPLAPALDAVELVGAWRANSRAFFEKSPEEPSAARGLVEEFLAAERERFDINDGHQTDAAFGIILEEREAWSIKGEGLSARARAIASRAVCDTLASARWADASRPENLASESPSEGGQGGVSPSEGQAGLSAWGKLAASGNLRRVERARPVVALAVMRMASFGKVATTRRYAIE